MMPIFSGNDFEERQRSISRHSGGVRRSGLCGIRSGSPTIRGILHYLIHGANSLGAMPGAGDCSGLAVLTSAAEFDSATEESTEKRSLSGDQIHHRFRCAHNTDAQLKPLFEAKVSRHV